MARLVARPMVRFLAQETASGLIMLVATAAALIWVNSPFGDTYDRFWDTGLAITVGSGDLLDLSLHGWVNDALMALFFFVVGMEIKAELVTGDLRDPRVAALPAIAALGGMVVPALLYLSVNLGNGSTRGWGVPMATDIAFAVGVLTLLGPRVPQPLKLFLLTLAIVDDIGAIMVIAVFYTAGIELTWLAIAVSLIGLILLLRRFRVWYIPVYAMLGLGVWFATHESGVHATIAGVVLGVMTPARPLLGHRAFERVEDIISGDAADAATARDASFHIRESVPLTGRLIALLSPWTSFVIIPIFALANAGVRLNGDAISAAAGSLVTLGILIGLVVGKPIGIYVFSSVALKAGWVSLPPGLRSIHLLGGGVVAGIGFTVALFIASLAFEDPAVGEEAVIGILAASILATGLGWLIVRRGFDAAEPDPDVPPGRSERVLADA
jgi:NhaA family Na+:H+ antiporter